MTEDGQPSFRAVVTHQDGRELDITEDLQVMYDAIVGSMDWGSGFLDSEEAAAISRVGEMCGFELKDYAEDECANCGHPYDKHAAEYYSDVTGLCFNDASSLYRNRAAITCPCPGYARRSLLDTTINAPEGSL